VQKGGMSSGIGRRRNSGEALGVNKWYLWKNMRPMTWKAVM
jgi:hypothetical protein